jgi:hypothetical protein
MRDVPVRDTSNQCRGGRCESTLSGSG